MLRFPIHISVFVLFEVKESWVPRIAWHIGVAPDKNGCWDQYGKKSTREESSRWFQAMCAAQQALAVVYQTLLVRSLSKALPFGETSVARELV